jgi:membrane dipeptidase
MSTSAGPDVTPIVDAHLDLGFNAVDRGFDLTASVAERRRVERRTHEQATTALPDLVRGGVALTLATIFAQPRGRDLGAAVRTSTAQRIDIPMYETPEEAHAIGSAHLDLYERWRDAGLIRIVTSQGELSRHLEQWSRDRVPGFVLLMEGADPIVAPSQLEEWFARGLRVVGPAWTSTRYAGGTGAPGPLTPLGRELIREMERLGVILDVSHLAEEAFWDATELATKVVATHAQPQALAPTDRHLSDAMLERVAGRGGVVGLTLVSEFLDGDWTVEGPRRVTLGDQWLRHAEHVAERIGWERIGIGSDLDGGVGVDECPDEIDSVADLGRIGDVVPERERAGVLGGNWIRCLARWLPA